MNITSINTNYNAVKNTQSFGNLTVNIPQDKYQEILDGLNEKEKEFLLNHIKGDQIRGTQYQQNMEIFDNKVKISSINMEDGYDILYTYGTTLLSCVKKGIRRLYDLYNYNGNSSDKNNRKVDRDGGWEPSAPTTPPHGPVWG